MADCTSEDVERRINVGGQGPLPRATSLLPCCSAAAAAAAPPASSPVPACLPAASPALLTRPFVRPDCSSWLTVRLLLAHLPCPLLQRMADPNPPTPGIAREADEELLQAQAYIRRVCRRAGHSVLLRGRVAGTLRVVSMRRRRAACLPGQ